MRQTGTADLPLHAGKCPPWLFSRMRLLAGAIGEVIIIEHGQEEFLRRLSNPFFFQSLGCVIGFDWHSSGLTTTVCGAFKEGLSAEAGMVVCGGKGSTSRKTPQEIEAAGKQFAFDEENISALTYASRMSAKVDNTAVQDGYQLYHHVFFLSESGAWCVVQQGMSDSKRYARRYHWLGEAVQDFVEEPHSGIAAMAVHEDVLDMTAKESKGARKASIDIASEGPEKVVKYLNEISTMEKRGKEKQRQFSHLIMPPHHEIQSLHPSSLMTLDRIKEISPQNFEELLAVRGCGPKLVRALALVAEIVHGAEPSWKDPAKFSFALGGKDGVPYPVDRRTYDATVQTLQDAIDAAKLGAREKLDAFRRLGNLSGEYGL